MEVSISFNKINGHKDLIEVLKPVFGLNEGDEVSFIVDLNTNNLLYSGIVYIYISLLKSK